MCHRLCRWVACTKSEFVLSKGVLFHLGQLSLSELHNFLIHLTSSNNVQHFSLSSHYDLLSPTLGSGRRLHLHFLSEEVTSLSLSIYIIARFSELFKLSALLSCV